MSGYVTASCVKYKLDGGNQTRRRSIKSNHISIIGSSLVPPAEPDTLPEERGEKEGCIGSTAAALQIVRDRHNMLKSGQ